MKPELTLSHDQIANFSIDVVKDFEGCPEALIFLKQIYQGETTNLRTRRQDFIHLVKKENKAKWVMNFLLNVMTKPYRIRFVCDIISEHGYLISDNSIKESLNKNLINILDYATHPNADRKETINKFCETLGTYRSNLKLQISQEVFVHDEKKFNELMSESQFLKGIITYVSHIKSPCTRSACNFFQSLSEALQWKYMLVDLSKSTLDSHALLLIKYTELFYGN